MKCHRVQLQKMPNGEQYTTAVFEDNAGHVTIITSYRDDFMVGRSYSVLIDELPEAP